MNSASNGHFNLEEDCSIINEGEFLEIRRREEGKFYRGKFISSNRYEEFSAQCSFQPLSGRETQQLPEGDRETVHVKVYTAFALKRDDIIVRNGESYEIQVLDNWGTYTKATARLIDVERN